MWTSSVSLLENYIKSQLHPRPKLVRPEGIFLYRPVMVDYNVAGLPAVFNLLVDVNGDVSILNNPDANFDLLDINNVQRTDENGNVSITYTDKLGRSILNRRVLSANEHADTYTVYDNFGNVRFVISPEASAQLTPGGTLAGLDGLIYEYRYDRRQRLIYKKVPGAEAVEYVYDYLDRIILTQDGNRRAEGEWLFTKYDVLGRVVMTGIHKSGQDRAALQTAALLHTDIDNDLASYDANPNNFFEIPTLNTAFFYYTNGNAFPVLVADDIIHTVNYYDDYNFDNDTNGTDDFLFDDSDAEYQTAADYRLNGQATGTLTNVLGESLIMLATAIWYDKYGRNIQVYAENHLDEEDISYFEYEFLPGKLLKSKRVHAAIDPADPTDNTTSNITIEQSYEYDHARRLENVYHSINGAAPVLLKNLQYNELDQLIQMNLHGDGSENFLQSVDYRYNERGWIRKINNVDFGNPSNTGFGTIKPVLKVKLQGAMENNGLMTTTLNNARSVLPGQSNNTNMDGHPYKASPWGYPGLEGMGYTDADYAPDVTDWVLVSFRLNTAADSEIFKIAGLLQRDGTITFEEETLKGFPEDLPPVYIVVEHCDHIGIMTPEPVEIVNDSLVYDFTLANSYTDNSIAYGQKQDPQTGEWMMYAGEGRVTSENETGYDINGADKVKWSDENGLFGSYLYTDFNRDGDVNGQDKILWSENNGVYSKVPRSVNKAVPNLEITPPIGGSTPVNAADDLFSMELFYAKPNKALNSTPQYNGNISHALWQSREPDMTLNDVRAYRYNYDNFDRVTAAHYAVWNETTANYSQNVDHYTVSDLAYDLNGNISQLKRQGQIFSNNYGAIDDLIYTYNNNQLIKVKDNSVTAGFTDGADFDPASFSEYDYDDNGNVIRDYNKGISAAMTYNHLNLPEIINVGDVLFWYYDAHGNKLEKLVLDNANNVLAQKDYIGGIEYEYNSNPNFPTVPVAVYHDEGRVAYVNGAWRYEYMLKDHLGNTRLIFADNGTSTPEVLQDADYYPFGMKHEGVSGTISPNATNYYQYNGKELNEDLGLDWYDYGARFYDAELGRWNAIDPHAGMYPSHSPYNYVMNNPVIMTDPTGKDAIVTINRNANGKGGTIKIAAKVYVTGVNAAQETISLNMEKAKYFKAGKYQASIDPEDVYNIKFDIQYKYIEDTAEYTQEKGTNLMIYTGRSIGGSHVPSKNGYKTALIREQGVYNEAGEKWKSKYRDDRPDGVIFKTYPAIHGYRFTTGSLILMDKEQSSIEIAIHETFHLLGLSDRYTGFEDENGNRTGTRKHIGFKNDVMQDNIKSIHQAHYNNWGRYILAEGKGEFTLIFMVDLEKTLDGTQKLIGGYDIPRIVPTKIK